MNHGTLRNTGSPVTHLAMCPGRTLLRHNIDAVWTARPFLPAWLACHPVTQICAESRAARYIVDEVSKHRQTLERFNSARFVSDWADGFQFCAFGLKGLVHRGNELLILTCSNASAVSHVPLSQRFYPEAKTAHYTYVHSAARPGGCHFLWRKQRQCRRLAQEVSCTCALWCRRSARTPCSVLAACDCYVAHVSAKGCRAPGFQKVRQHGFRPCCPLGSGRPGVCFNEAPHDSWISVTSKATDAH